MAEGDPVIDLARSRPFRLGGLEVDPPRRRVSTGETLEPRVMQVLVALARANGAVVSRDELIRTCWDGRIVGEDSITRVVGALRRLAEKRGGGSFRIETVPKVGYRLVGDVTPIVAPAGPEPVCAPTAVATTSAKSWRWWLAAAAAAALAGVVDATWRSEHTDHPVTVHFAGYRALGTAVPVGLPEAVADATLAAFTEDGQVAVTTGSGGGDFRLGGSIDRAGDVLRVAARIDDLRSGVTLWSRVLELPAAEAAHVATRTAALTVSLARCALSQQAVYGKPLADKVLTLLFAECAAETTPDAHGKALDLARQITEVQPDLASGWSSRAFVANGLAQGSVPARASALGNEAAMAAAKALTLDPRDSRAWHVKVYLTPSTDLPAIDRAFQRALRARLSECGCVFMDYGKFLLETGRAAAAGEMFRRARDVVPLSPSPLMGLGRIEAGEGRAADAKVIFAKLSAIEASPNEAANVVISNAMWTRDYAGALRLFQGLPRSGPPALATAIEDGFRALASGDATAKAKAAAELGVVQVHCGCNGAFNIRMIAALGDTPGALAALTALAAKHPFHTREAVGWDPVFTDVRRQPGFAPLAAKLGLVNYWRAMKVKPDYCGEANAPPLCATI